MQLPEPFAKLINPLFDALPLDRAMAELVPTRKADPSIVGIVEEIAVDPIGKSNPSLLAGLWLYVDELDRSHTISQAIPGPTGSTWHGIMHRREGDFWNSKYWFRQAGPHPALTGENPSAFVDQVEQTYKNNPIELLAYQRNEWAKLFEWCAQEAVG